MREISKQSSDLRFPILQQQETTTKWPHIQTILWFAYEFKLGIKTVPAPWRCSFSGEKVLDGPTANLKDYKSSLRTGHVIMSNGDILECDSSQAKMHLSIFE